MRLAGGAILTGILVGTVCACGTHASTSARPTPSSTDSSDGPSRSGSTQPPVVSPPGARGPHPRDHLGPAHGLPTCDADQLHLRVGASDSAGQAPFAIVVVHNAGRPCRLVGYPRLASRAVVTTGAPGQSARARPGRAVQLQVGHGIYEHVTRHPRPVAATRRRPVVFYLGTAAAYQGGAHPLTLESVEVELGAVSEPTRLTVDILATKPPRGRLPLGVTTVESCPTSPRFDGTDLGRACGLPGS